MRVWLQVNVGGATVDHYDWKILSWRNQVPHGTLTNYASVVDINSASSRYIVRTSGNRIRYDSTTIQELLRLTGTFQQTIEVTAWTREGRFANAYFTVRLNAGGGDGGGGGGGGGTPVTYSLTSSDAPSHARSTSYADYYRLAGSGPTTITMTGFDTYLYLYDDQLRLITSDDDGAGNLGSRITYTLVTGRTYYVEATSYSPWVTGSYQMTVTGASLTPTSNPWSGVGNCPNIAGDYSVTETVTMTIASQGQSETVTETGTVSVRITQTGCSFSYQAVDPTGTFSPVTRTGTINGNTLTLQGDAYVLTTDPALRVTSNTMNASGTISGNTLTINSTGYVVGTYDGSPFRIDSTGRAVFTRR
jgi:hypothetical protein